LPEGIEEFRRLSEELPEVEEDMQSQNEVQVAMDGAEAPEASDDAQSHEAQPAMEREDLGPEQPESINYALSGLTSSPHAQVSSPKPQDTEERLRNEIAQLHLELEDMRQRFSPRREEFPIRYNL